jgi:VanZ family protein
VTRQAWNWALVLAYMGVLFAFSSVQNPPALPGEPSDKLMHGLLYAGLGSVSLRALVDRRWDRVTARRAMDAVLIAVAYGGFDEFHQSFVIGRQSDFADLSANTVGAAAAAVVLWLWGILSRWKSAQGRPNTGYRIPNADYDETADQ